jgi:PAS domain S-box-containing protein
MDYFVWPDTFVRFLMYRLIAAGMFGVLYVLNRRRRSRTFQYFIASLATTLCAVIIELAVLDSGGQSSIYYAAMIILAICGLGFVPISMPLAFTLVGIVYAIYVVPILLTETITGGVFVGNNAFLLSSFVMGLLLRYNNQKLIMSELRLRAELHEEKRKLELQSLSLQDQVAEKTGELAISEQKYRGLFDHATDGIAVLDRNGAITDVNRQFCALHARQREELIGTDYGLLAVRPRTLEHDARIRQILSGDSLLFETEHLRSDGSRVHLEVSARAIEIGGVVHIQSFHRDITEKKQLQEQAIQSQKMESMGVLAGGIAHDFNNTLTAILGHTEVLRRRLSADGFGLRRLKTIEDAAARAGLMVSKLMSFARKESLELVPTDLNSVVMDTADLLGRTFIDRNVTAKVESEPRVPGVSGDSIHLEQVITNLALNAMDAMPGGGTITFTTSVITVDAKHSPLRPLLAPGKYVVLTIGDTGTGMTPEVKTRIFEPFFTTKPVGKGTGLGLAMVYGIVKSHGGEITVRSEVGIGSTFEIYFPALDRPAGPRTLTFDSEPQFDAAGSECILVVDDEPDVLSYIKDVLDAHGYKTFATDNPVYAQALFAEMTNDIDLVVTDMVMPLLSGADLTRHFKSANSQIKVIGITGFSGGKIAAAARDLDAMIKKPFDSAKLLSTVRTVLDRHEEQGPAS